MNDPNIINDRREMALTHKDFFRILPRAVGDHSYQIDGSRVQVQVYDGKVVIDIGTQQLRKIALMEVPWCLVEFQASDISVDQFRIFSEKFHRHFQRGGG